MERLETWAQVAVRCFEDMRRALFSEAEDPRGSFERVPTWYSAVLCSRRALLAESDPYEQMPFEVRERQRMATGHQHAAIHGKRRPAERQHGHLEQWYHGGSAGAEPGEEYKARILFFERLTPGT